MEKEKIEKKKQEILKKISKAMENKGEESSASHNSHTSSSKHNSTTH